MMSSDKNTNDRSYLLDLRYKLDQRLRSSRFSTLTDRNFLLDLSLSCTEWHEEQSVFLQKTIDSV